MDELPDPDLGSRPTRSRRVRKKKLDDLLDPSLVVPLDPSGQPPPTVDLIPPGSSEYKNKLKVYVLSGQIKDLYGKIITEHELNKMSEQECENVYKICELKMVQRISG